MMKKDKKSILVIASTYPRWKNDSVPAFVQQFCYHMSNRYKMHALVPHYKGAKRKEKDNDVSVARFRYAYPESAENIVYNGGGVFKIKKTPMYALKLVSFMISELYNTYRLSIAKKVAIINAHWIVPQGFVAVLVKLVTRKKVVLTVHGGDLYGVGGKFLQPFKKFVLKHADVVVVNSSAMGKLCRDVYPKVNYAVIPMGVELEYFLPSDKPAELIEQYNLKDEFTILFIGRLTKVKGVKYLLEALKQLADDGRQFKALIVGEGPEEESLRAYVRDSGMERSVVFIGWVNKAEITDYYNLADVFVGPSLEEALGLVFVEAQSCGLPVVATNVGGIPDVIVDGETGFLVKKESGLALYEKLSQLQDDRKLLAKMAKTAPQKMSKEFSWDSVAERYAKVFDELI